MRTRHTNAREIAAAFETPSYTQLSIEGNKIFGAEVSVGSNYGNAASLT